MTKRLIAIVVCVTAALVYVRHDPELPDRLFHYGNTLATSDGSGYSMRTFQDQLARLELAIIVGLFAWVATHKRAIAGAAVIFTAIYTDSMWRVSTRVAGRLYFAMCDDALISMRYARNYAEGRGLVYNAGEYVDGFSNPLWTFLMIIPHALGLHEGVATAPILALAGLALLGAGLLAYRVLDAEDVPLPLAVFAFFAIVLDASTFEFAITGLETTALALGSSAVIFGHYRKRDWIIATGLVVLALSRADGVVVAVLLAAWRVREEKLASGDAWKIVLRRQARPLAALAIATIGLTAWRMALYGHPAPNTAYLKVFSLGQRLKNGIPEYGERGLLMYGIPAAFVLLAPAVDERVRRARRMLHPVLLVWAYAIYVGGDAFVYMRFLGPVTPLLWMSVALAVAPLWPKWERNSRVFALAIMALLVPVKSERGLLGLSWDRTGFIDDLVVSAKSIERNVPEGKTIGTFYAGFAYYAPHHSFVDLLGKTESHIAHEEEVHGIIPGHNKYDFAYAYTVRKPDVTLTAMFCHEIERFLARPPAEREHDVSRTELFSYKAPSDQILDPLFQQLYLPHRVALKEDDHYVGHRLGCWFVREGAAVPVDWQLARQ